MRLELFAFVALILGPPIVASIGRPTFVLARWRRAWVAAGLASAPMLVWLLWWTLSGVIRWSPAHTLVGGPVPPGALLLVPAIAFACVFCWWAAFRGRFLGFMVAVALLTLAFGGALLERGVVEHDYAAQLGLRLLGVPVEDLGFALVLASASVLAFEWLERGAADAKPGLIARFIERRLGGYRQPLAPVDESRPRELSEAGSRSVVIVGAGLAGLGAACKLAERGFAVTLLERNDYIGGKLGAWTTTSEDGEALAMNHGFHAFFRHYYNLDAFLRERGVARHLTNIGDYLILTHEGERYSFKDIATTPILNLLSLARHGFYKLREVAKDPTGPQMEALLRYDPATTPAEYDGLSYAEFAARAKLPDNLALVFNTFSRAFFSDADKMSMAELIKSFHFYYLSNDNGLLYDHLDGDFEATLLAPLRAHLREHGATIRTGVEVGEIVREDDGRVRVSDERFDYLILAADVVGTRAIMAGSPSLAAAAPETARKVETLRPGQRYSVLRLWLDRDVERDLPAFIITERVTLLDAVSFVHRAEREAARWVEARAAAQLGGGVIELHCYALPEDLTDDPAEESAALRALFLAEMVRFFPELKDAAILHEAFYVRRDFPAFHVGMHATRPSWETELDNVFLAGDWVVLPFPAMLMEAAYSAGLLAQNAIARAEGLREDVVWTVPKRGLMAGMPKRPF